MKLSYQDSRKLSGVSIFTKIKISESLKGKLHTIETRKKMSESKSGAKNFYYGKILHIKTRLAAHYARSIKVYVYCSKDKTLINNSPFLSIRKAVKVLFINPGTLRKKWDTGLAFKGYLYYTYLIK